MLLLIDGWPYRVDIDADGEARLVSRRWWSW